ncbi:MAG: hypothetical protein H6723_15900 [Sandaracinus sp.]|nr:hypothetical protein [Sandaracinus sp.]
MKKKLRRPTVDGAPYLWSVGHLHFPRNEPPGDRCAERLTVYREGFRKAPAKLTFVATDGVLVGYPSSGSSSLGETRPSTFTPRWSPG